MNTTAGTETTETPALQAAAVTTPSRGGQYPETIYVRATRAEKERVRHNANKCGMSLSRYLVALALEGKAPPTDADRKRLGHLLFLFKRAETGLLQVTSHASELERAGLSESFQAELRETTQMLSALAAELSRRL